MRLFLTTKKEYGQASSFYNPEWKLVNEDELHHYAQGYVIHEITQTKPVQVAVSIKTNE